MRRVGRADGAKRPRRPHPEAARGAAATKGKGARAGQAEAPAPKPQPTRREVKAQTQEVLATGVQTLQVEPTRPGCGSTASSSRAFPQLAFTHIQRIVRKGELRVDGKRAKPKERLEAGQKIRIPPLKLEQPKVGPAAPAADQDERDFLNRSRSTRTRTSSSSTSHAALPCRAGRARSAMSTACSRP